MADEAPAAAVAAAEPAPAAPTTPAAPAAAAAPAEKEAAVAPAKPKATGVRASAATVRQHCAEGGFDLDRKPNRNVDARTGALEIFASSDALMQWVPKFDRGLVALWCRLPIFKARLFRNREAYNQGGLDRCYVEQAFPEGEDLLTAIVWWRKRVGRDSVGFAVFEAGFDTSGLPLATEPPRCLIDAETGEVEADGEDAIERKRELHRKRRAMGARWADKGVSAELQQRIERSEALGAERRRRGEVYALRGGWVPAAAAGGGAAGFDVAGHNERQKLFGCR